MPNCSAPSLLTSYFNKIFTHEVFSLLLREKLIGFFLVQKILLWRHPGFNVHGKVWAQTKGEAERVGKSMIRAFPSAFLAKIEHLADVFVPYFSGKLQFVGESFDGLFIPGDLWFDELRSDLFSYLRVVNFIDPSQPFSNSFL
jgi:hypothetical protein